MLKAKAIELLGGPDRSIALVAHEIGISYQAVDKWPDELPDRIADRVIAAVAKKRYPELLGEKAPALTDPAADTPAAQGA